jgi:hypothetical protein
MCQKTKVLALQKGSCFRNVGVPLPLAPDFKWIILPEACGRPEPEKVEHFSAKLQELLKHLSRYDESLWVGVTEYCKLQGKMISGSVAALSKESRALDQHR